MLREKQSRKKKIVGQSKKKSSKKMERMKDFDICFSGMFSCYDKSFIFKGENGH